MNVQRFFAGSSREALKNVKANLGPDAVILSNNSVDGGVEILAIAGADISQLAQPVVSTRNHRARTVSPSGAQAGELPEALRPRELRGDSRSDSRVETPPPAQAPAAPESQVKAQAELTMAKNVISEIKSLRGVVEDQLASMVWGELARRDPLRSKVMRELLRCGFSAQLARKLVARMPADIDAKTAATWVRSALALNLLAVPTENEIVGRGGVYALVGPTGVGKTTTAAKLAARCVVRYGASKVALLTTDGYRVGAHEQLRIYGKILGLAVHAVKDATDLHITLSELRNKHLVLIDTVGMSQRDQRVADQIAMLSGAGAEVKRLLVLPATSSGETLEDVVSSYQRAHAVDVRARAGDVGARGLSGAIFTKIDEAVNLGTLLDVAMRHRLAVHYVANGQRVPEDLHVPNVQYLLHRALRPEGSSVFALEADEVPLVIGAKRKDAGFPQNNIRPEGAALA